VASCAKPLDPSLPQESGVVLAGAKVGIDALSAVVAVPYANCGLREQTRLRAVLLPVGE
jgi:hypothetical protein